MKLLATIRDSDLFEGVVDADPVNFRLRTAARAVVFDEGGRVALLKVGKLGYCKLPGGGVEEGEDIRQALERELIEEIGCKVEIVGEVGEVIQYLNKKELKQVSFCYLTKQIGEKNQPDFTDEEVENGFEVRWADNINDAIWLVKGSKTDDYSGLSIVRRDLTLLMAAKQCSENL